jgi:uncharacterized protein YjbI with pentapeptide repeats
MLLQDSEVTSTQTLAALRLHIRLHNLFVMLCVLRNCSRASLAAAYILAHCDVQDLRRSNFTSANAKRAIFKDANLQGAYFIKAVTYKANFEVRYVVLKDEQNVS